MKVTKKMKDALYTWSPPQKVNVFIEWIHVDELNRQEVSHPPIYFDHFSELPAYIFLFYRNLMLEAGFVPRYLWSRVNEPAPNVCTSNAVKDWGDFFEMSGVIDWKKAPKIQYKTVKITYKDGDKKAWSVKPVKKK